MAAGQGDFFFVFDFMDLIFCRFLMIDDFFYQLMKYCRSYDLVKLGFSVTTSCAGISFYLINLGF